MQVYYKFATTRCFATLTAMRRKCSAVAHIIILILALMLSGCDDNGLSNYEGWYHGHIQYKDLWVPVRAQAVQKDKVIETVVQLAQGFTDPGIPGYDRFAWRFKVEEAEDDQIFVRGPDSWPISKPLKKIPDKNCYAYGLIRDHPEALLCSVHNEIRFLVNSGLNTPQFSLVLEHDVNPPDRVKDTPQPPMEEPNAYDLSQIVDQTLKRNFDSDLAWNNVEQMRARMRLNYLNLLPHISGSSAITAILGILSGDLSSLANAVGDLVPFILPNRILQALEGDAAHEAAIWGWATQRADSANMAENLAYAILRDQKVLVKLRSNYTKVQEIHAEIKQREDDGQIQLGTTADIKHLILALEQEMIGLASFIRSELQQLSQTIGFRNPKAVRKVLAQIPYNLKDVKLPNLDHTSSFALEVSFELRQMNELIIASGYNETERIFNWADPAGDSSGSLGFGLGYYIAIGKKQTEALLKTRQHLADHVKYLIQDCYEQIEMNLRQYEKSVNEGSKIENERITLRMNQLANGTLSAGNLTDLILALQDQVRNDIAITTAEYSYYILRAKLDRLLYAGSYSGLLSR